MKAAFPCLLALLWVAGPSVAQPVVIELFSSQNCKACPKAHTTLKAVSEADGDLLVLTWSVDYWDYLGDADPMAMDESKERQARYVEQFGLRGPYTPQTVYNGLAQCPGNRPSAVRRNLAAVRAVNQPSVSIQPSATGLLIEGPDAMVANVTLVEYLPDSLHDTGMRHPIIRAARLGQFKGEAITLPMPDCANDCAVLLETADHGIVASHVLATAGLNTPN